MLKVNTFEKKAFLLLKILQYFVICVKIIIIFILFGGLYMDSTYTKRLSYFSLVILSFIMGFFFFLKNYLDIMIGMCNTGNFNISNIAFFVLRIIESLIIPAIFLVPWNIEFGRIKMSRLCFILYGAFQLLTLSWIVSFLCSDHIGFSTQAITLFQSEKTSEIFSNLYMWDTYGWISVPFTLISGLLAIYTGISFDDDRIKVRNCLIGLFSIKLVFPIIANIINKNFPFSLTWILNNYGPVIVWFLLFSAIIIVSMSDMTWIECIWEQDALDPAFMEDENNQNDSENTFD